MSAFRGAIYIFCAQL